MQVTQTIESNRTKATLVYARLIQRGLTQLGFTSKHGDVEWPVILSNVQYYRPRDVGLIEVDVHRLPRRVRIDKLKHENVLNHLSTVIGKPVRIANGVRGLTYVIPFKAQEEYDRPRLPSPPASLDLTARPAGAYQVPIGVDAEGRGMWRDLLEVRNALIGGKTGGGKTNLLHGWLCALTQNPPEVFTFSIIDIKGVDFDFWRGCPNLKQLIRNPDDIPRLVTGIEDEIQYRQDLMAGVARSIDAYNKISENPIPVHLVVFDELTAFMSLNSKERNIAMNAVAKAALMGRSLGIHFAFGAQRAANEMGDFVGRIKAATETHICFHTRRKGDSVTIIGDDAANTELPNRTGYFIADIKDERYFLHSWEVETGLIKACAGVHPTDKDRVLLEDMDRRIAKLALDDGGRLHQETIYEGLGGGASNGGLSYAKLNRRLQRWDRRGWSTKTLEGRVITDEMRELLKQDAESARTASGMGNGREPISFSLERAKRESRAFWEDLGAHIQQVSGG